MEISFGKQIEEISAMASKDGDGLLHEICSYLKSKNSKYNWVGIYIIDGTNLRLETFVGRPTEHTLIPIGEGLCGQAIAKKEIVNEPDVSANTEYLSCSIETKSELVVPIWHKDQLVGEVDIDSDMPRAFTEEDESFLKSVGHIISKDVYVRYK